MGYYDEDELDLTTMLDESDQISDSEYAEILGIEDENESQSEDEFSFDDIEDEEVEEKPAKKKKKKKPQKQAVEPEPGNNGYVKHQEPDYHYDDTQYQNPDYNPYDPYSPGYQEQPDVDVKDGARHHRPAAEQDMSGLDVHGVHVIGIDSVENLEDAAMNGDLNGVRFGEADVFGDTQVNEPERPVVHFDGSAAQPLSSFGNLHYTSEGKMEEMFAGFGVTGVQQPAEPVFVPVSAVESAQQGGGERIQHESASFEELHGVTAVDSSFRVNDEGKVFSDSDKAPVVTNDEHGNPYLVNGSTFNAVYKSEFSDASAIVFAASAAAMPEGAKVVDMSADQSGKILAWQDGDTLYVAPQAADMPLMANPDSSYMFANNDGLHSIDFGVLQTGNTVNMNSMVANCPELQHVNTEKLNVEAVTDMRGIFANCENVEQIDVSTWKPQKNVVAEAAFDNCPAASQYEVESIWSSGRMYTHVHTESMFHGYDEVPVLPTKYAAQPVVVYEKADGESLNEMYRLNYGSPVPNNVASDVPYMVNGVTFNNVVRTEFATASAIVFSESAAAMPASAKTVDLSADQSGRILAWQDGGTVYVAPKNADMPLFANPDSSHMFSNNETLKSIDFGSLQTGQVVSMNSMMANCYELKDANIEKLNVSKVQDMSGMMANTENVQPADISGWRVQQGVDATAAFSKSNAVTADAAQAVYARTEMGTTELFRGYGADVTVPVNGYIRPVTVYEKTTSGGTPYLMRGSDFNATIQSEFGKTERISFADVKIPEGVKTIDVSADKSGRILAWEDNGTVHVATTSPAIKLMANPDAANMFSNNDGLKAVDIGRLDTSDTRTMNAMFANNPSLTTVNAEKLKMGATEDIRDMFANTENIQKVNTSHWDTQKVTQADGAFAGSSGFNKEEARYLRMDAPIVASAFVASSPVQGVYEKTTDTGVPYLMRGRDFNITIQSEFGSAERISFGETRVPEGVKTVDVSADKSGRIVAWEVGGTVHVATTDPTMKLMANPDASQMFANNAGLKSVDIGKLDTSNTRTMNGMFANNPELTTVNAEKLKMGSTEDVRNMFTNTENMQKVNTAGWDTSKITQAEGAFAGSSAVSKEDVKQMRMTEAVAASAFVASKPVSEIHAAVSHTSTKIMPDLVEGKIAPDGTAYMMKGAAFNTLYKKEFSDASEVVFSTGRAVPKDAKTFDVSADKSGRILMWKEGDTVHVSTTSAGGKLLANPDASNMLTGLMNLKKVDIGALDTSRTRDMANLFANSVNLSAVNVEKLKMGNVTDISGMFMNLEKAEKLNVGKWDTSNVKYMIGTFKGAGVTDLDVSKWKTGKVVDLTGTFAEMKNVRQLNLSGWDVSNVKSLNSTFANNSKLVTLTTDGWNTAKVENMNNMLFGNKNLTNFDPSRLRTDSLVTMAGMVTGATALNKDLTAAWVNNAAATVAKNNMALVANDILRKMTPEQKAQMAAKLGDKQGGSYTPQQVLDYAKANKIGIYSDAKGVDKKTAAEKAKEIDAKTNAKKQAESPFQKAKEDDIDKIVQKRQVYKFVGENQHRVRNAVGNASRKLSSIAKNMIENDAFDEDQRKAMHDVGAIGRVAGTVITAAGGMSIFKSAKKAAKQAQIAAFNTDKLIQDGILTVGDLRKDKSELSKVLRDGLSKNGQTLSKKEIEAILKNRQQTYDLYMIRQNMSERIGAGQFTNMSLDAKGALKDTRFTNLNSKEMHEVISAYGRGSKNPIMKRIDGLSNKDIDKILKNANKYDLTANDVSVLRLKKAQNKMRKAKMSKPKLMVTIAAGARVLANMIKKADDMAAEGLSVLSNGVAIIAGTKGVIIASTKAARYSIKFVHRAGRRFLAFVDRKTGAITALRNGTKAIGKAAGKAIANSAPGKAVSNAAGKVARKVSNSAVGRGAKTAKSTVSKHKNKVREMRRKKLESKAAVKARAAQMRLQAKAAVNRAMNTTVGRIISAPFRVLALPFKVFGAVGRAVGAVAAGIKKLLSYVAAAVGGLLLTVMLLIFIIAGMMYIMEGAATAVTNVMSLFDSMNSAETMTAEEIEAAEENEHKILQAAYNRIESHRDELMERVDNIANGVPQNPTVYCGHTIEQYGHPDSSGNWVNGSTIYYLDANGNRVTTTIDNSKDAIVMAYVIMGEDFFKDEEGRNALIQAFYTYLNPSPTYTESSIYYCPAGCEELEYHCVDYAEVNSITIDDNNGMKAFDSYAYNVRGEYYEIWCEGHKIYAKDADGNYVTDEDGDYVTYQYYHNNGNVKRGASPMYHLRASGTLTKRFSDGNYYTFTPPTTCYNYGWEYYCDADMGGHYGSGVEGCPHKVTVCYGHKDVTVYLQRRTMEDLFEDGYSLSRNSAYNKYIDNFDGWNDENVEWATTLRDADWGELYGIYEGHAASGMNGTAVALQLWVKLRDEGFSEAATAAIIGNAMQESSLDPTCDGVATGLFQFEGGTGNASAFKNYAAQQGKPWTDVGVQVDYLLMQLESAFQNYTGWTRQYDFNGGAYYGWPEKMTLSEFKATDGRSNVAELTEIFERVYERASIPRMENRVSYALGFYDMYKGYDGSGTDIVNYALQFVGNPYVWGGDDLENGIDCSHFVWRVLLNTGHYSGGWHQSTDWQNVGTRVNGLENAQPGDILVWEGHVAIYIGEGTIVHASNSKPYPQGGIKVSTNVDLQSYHGGLIAIRRFT